MASTPQMSAADVGDRHRRYVAFAMLAVSGIYALSAARPFLGAGAARAAGILELVMVAATLGFLVPVFLWKVRSRDSDDWHLYRRRDGFVAESVARAHLASWIVTFVLLSVFAQQADRFGELPPEFFLESTLAVMLGVFGVVFLYLSRTPGEDDLEDLDA